MASNANPYGVTLKPSEMSAWLEHVLRTNLRLVKDGKKDKRMCACIWGPAGISKTATVKQFEKRGININGEMVYPKVVHIALAQMEEAADVATGLPIEEVIDGRTVMGYAPPSWWPTEKDTLGGKRPVVLLFDDFNRADPRILKAIMQILQDYRSNVHELPENTIIVLTGNPPTGDDGTEYSVNEIDKAVKTRMLHAMMKFDKIDWASWAVSEKVDDRVVSYVLAYPEMVNGEKSERTNPRSVEQFALLIKDLPSSKDNAAMIQIAGAATMDDEVVQSFMKFTLGEMSKLVSPEEILEDWKRAEAKLDSLKKRGADGEDSKVRTDLIGIIVDRMYVHLMQEGVKLSKSQMDNFVSFIKRSDIIPEDLMYALLRRLRRDAKGDQQKLIQELVKHGGKEISELIMKIV